jgi:hypothetical protein
LRSAGIRSANDMKRQTVISITAPGTRMCALARDDLVAEAPGVGIRWM